MAVFAERSAPGALYHHHADEAELYLVVIGETWWDETGPVFSALEGDDPCARGPWSEPWLGGPEAVNG